MFNILNDTLTVGSKDTLDKLGDVKGKVLKDKLLNTPEEGKAKTLNETMGNVKGKPSTHGRTFYIRRGPRKTSTDYAM